MRFIRFLPQLAIVLGFLCLVQGTAYANNSNKPLLYEDKPINLLQPLDGSNSTQLPAQPGIGILFTYFNYAWPWVLGTAAGVGVLQALYGGVQIMLSAGNDMKDEGKERIKWALAGLLMVGLSGLILETLNPLFFVQV